MRLLVLLLLLTSAAAHPAAVQTLVALGAHAMPALSHVGGAACGLHAAHAAHATAVAGPTLRLGTGGMATLGSHWNALPSAARPLGSHWNNQGT